MNYKLNISNTEDEKGDLREGLQELFSVTRNELKAAIFAFTATLISSGASLLAPLIIGHTIDSFIAPKNFHGVVQWSLILLGVYAVGTVANYFQTLLTGQIGLRVLFNLRNAIFNKLQGLPIAFFNQNKSGDLISRINNDTQKLNDLFSQSLMRFVGGLVSIVGTGVFLLVLNWRLGLATLLPAIVVLVIVQRISPWVQRQSLKSLQSLGRMSAEIQESLKNFKVMVAFNRLDYFREKFGEANTSNYRASIQAGVASNLFSPLFDFANDSAQLIVLAYGIYLVSTGHFTIGLLISFLLYATNFYNPLRQFAMLWSDLQLALAGLQRISNILTLKSDLAIVDGPQTQSPYKLEMKDVSFHYFDSGDVLHHVSLQLEKGKTYALVGPTGGGKTTTASLMARLYDPTEGVIMLDGKDIRSYQPDVRAQKIGFILQEPFLFSGTVRDNIVYGNEEFAQHSAAQMHALLEKEGLSDLMDRFEQGLETKVTAGGDTISLGQKQLIAFIRAVLRRPELLILDEATANIDTVTEQSLQKVLDTLPAETTKVIIAHRLNTIRDADEICFVNAGTIVSAGSMQQAVDMLLHGARKS